MKEKIHKLLTSCSMSIPSLLLTAKAYAASANTTVSVNGMTSELNSAIGDIISIMFWIACVVCTIKIIHIGILYMTTGVEGKSKAKGALIPWVVGVFICVTFATLGPAIMNLFYTGKSVLDY
ncbi:MAG: hypothetical protein J6B87_00195 [Clostridia bacterium]|nr:hypothetical protein [Clostridia bacterium]